MTTRGLSGAEKAVLLLLSLEESAAAPIVGELSAEHIKLLRETASKMRSVPANALHAVYGPPSSSSCPSTFAPPCSAGSDR